MTATRSNRRPRKLVEAALSGFLHYGRDDVLYHRSFGGEEIPATAHDAEIIAALADLGLLRRGESGVLTAAGVLTPDGAS